MYLRRATIKNLRTFDEDGISLNFELPSLQNPSWTLVLGDNGVGKTSLLRSIAMGLCDETTASGLLRELGGELVRHGAESAEIALDLQSAESVDERLRIVTTIHRSSSGAEEEVEQTIDPPDPTLRSRIFACGYGARRAAHGGQIVERHRLDDSLYTLFNYDSDLLNPEVYLLRLRDTVNIEGLLTKLETVLLLPRGSITLDRSGFVINGPWGKFVPIGSIGDGYASTLAWICDLFGWSSLFHGDSFSGELSGIVLMDELEQHLHPSWQRELVGQLAGAFPQIQFVATTHSPLAIIGSASLPDGACQLVLLEQAGDSVVSRAPLTPPRNKRADQVLTSYLFGLASTVSDGLTNDVARYSQLASSDALDAVELAEKEVLRERLHQTLDGDESPLQQLVREAVHKALSGLAHEGLTSVSPEPLDFEVRRQLAELFGPS